MFQQGTFGKQSWRLLQNPDNLTTKILRGKYYPSGTILNARLGSKPSYAWRSIHGAIELLESGLIWRIGDGATVGIWHDRWIPLPSTFMIQSQPKSIQINAKVEELIDVDTKWWNMQRLKENFSSEEVRAITSIPLSGVGHSDVKV
jgi:hypothetical protein